MERTEMMAQESTFVLSVPGSNPVELSLEGLRTILGQIETELYRSEVYRRAVDNLQQPEGENGNGAQFLVKAVGREAIRLALRHFVRRSQASEGGDPSVSPRIAAPAEVKPIVQPDRLPEATPEPPRLNSPSLQATATSKKSGEKPRKLTKAELLLQKANQAREARLRQLGTELQQAREARGLSLRHLHSQTLVPMHHLLALEAGRLEQLPEDIYIRGFVRRIGNALGLDGIALADSIPTPDPIKSVLPSWNRPALVSGFQIQPVHLYLGYAGLMAGGLVWLSQQLPPDPAAPSTPSPSSETKPTSRSKADIPNHKPGLKASPQGVAVGPDIAPPETPGVAGVER